MGANTDHADDAEVAADDAEDFGPESILKEMDKDTDGFLSLAEFLDMESEEGPKKEMEKAFSNADADADGKLSVAEVAKLVGFVDESEDGAESGSQSVEDM